MLRVFCEPAGRLTLALVLLFSSVWVYKRASGLTPETPLADYCGVGVCSLFVPNHLLTLPEPGSNRLLMARQALRARPSSPYAWADAAELEWRNGDRDKARLDMAKALQLAPANLAIQIRFNHLENIASK